MGHFIVIKGVRRSTILKNIDVEIPRDTLVGIIGLSGWVTSILGQGNDG